MLAVAGLGNPGDSYRDTRHNAGWMLLDRLRGRGRVVEERRRDWSELARLELRGREVWLIRPETYMNRSGLGVSDGCDALELGPGEILVAYDDADLPLGRIRLRPSGGSGGHKGMQSVIDALGSDRIPRLRLGIRGEDAPEELTDYVLGPFAEEERETADEMVERAADAVVMVLRAGLAAAMNEFNADT